MEPFKNMLGLEAARKISKAMRRAHPAFVERRFLKGLAGELEPLELKARMLFLKDRLIRELPEEPRRAFPLLVDALQQDEGDRIGLEGFLVWPLTQVVAERGLERFEASMATLHRMTQVFTAEFAVRPFFLRLENRTLAQFAKWSEDPSEHVRRLVSEGSRPYLPWGERLPRFAADPELTWPLLHSLRGDPSLYVRKSVANHLNDHSRSHGDWVVKRLGGWKSESGNACPKEMSWVIRHATRTLVKRGHRGALRLHGVKSSRIRVASQEILTPRLRVGETLRTRIELRNLESREARVILDQEIGFLRARGENRAKVFAKVFKGRDLRIGPRETRVVELDLPIRSVTIRSYYPGMQGWTPIVNGVRARTLEFRLRESA